MTDGERLAVIETKLEERSKALDERLKALNNLHAEMAIYRDHYLRTDVYEGRHKELQQQMKGISDTVAVLSTAQSRMIGIGIAFMAVAGLLGHFWK